jgi:hypothetical protein
LELNKKDLNATRHIERKRNIFFIKAKLKSQKQLTFEFCLLNFDFLQVRKQIIKRLIDDLF